MKGTLAPVTDETCEHPGCEEEAIVNVEGVGNRCLPHIATDYFHTEVGVARDLLVQMGVRIPKKK